MNVPMEKVQKKPDQCRSEDSCEDYRDDEVGAGHREDCCQTVWTVCDEENEELRKTTKCQKMQALECRPMYRRTVTWGGLQSTKRVANIPTMCQSPADISAT